ncbi:homing endonuclease associated repeat-containing protein [Bacillus glycinifermentans]|uniref:homing endonuclease associated repeat-containing protein n=1 Tax=Bacillus glycinifermentans TaxID=1664069 RepID=UPI00398B9065
MNRVGTRTKPYTKEELIEILCQKANELGRSPKFYEVIQRHTVIKYFGSFNEGLIAAGLSPNKKTKRLKG